MPLVMGQEAFPKERMTPERLEVSKSFGLASRLQFTHPEPEPTPEPVQPHITSVDQLAAVGTAGKVESARQLALVGQTIGGRECVVLQVPGGQVRYEGIEEGATEAARRLAGEESAAFVVMRPLRVCQPQTIINEDVL
jgi:hypothetical protein